MIKLVLIFFMVSFCCDKQKVRSIATIDLFSQPSVEITRLSEIALDVDYVPLQTSINSFIRNIYDIKAVGNKIYINTPNPSEIICFDKAGKYLYKLDRIGRGPEEYTGIFMFDVSTDNDILIVLTRGKILIFRDTGKNFLFQRSLNFKNQPSYIDFIPNQTNILISKSSSYEMEHFRNVLINIGGDTILLRPNHYRYSKIGDGNIVFKNDNISYKYNNALYFKDMFSDTIFSVDQTNKIKPYLILDSHGKIPSVEDRANATYFFKHGTEFIMFSSIFEVSKYIFYSFSYKKSQFNALYEKSSKKKFEIKNGTSLIDDITGGINFEPKFCCDGKWYSWIDALSLKKYLSEDNFMSIKVKNPEKKEVLEKLSDSLRETDNPVLIVVTPKE